MPESKGRKEAAVRKKQARQHETAELRADRQRRQPSLGTGRSWVVPTFATLGLLGVAWLVIWYVTTATGVPIPFMAALGGWNMLIGMGLMAAAFGVSTLWK